MSKRIEGCKHGLNEHQDGEGNVIFFYDTHPMDTCYRCLAERYRDTLERLERDIVLDRQEADYYKRIIKVHADWIREALRPTQPAEGRET